MKNLTSSLTQKVANLVNNICAKLIRLRLPDRCGNFPYGQKFCRSGGFPISYPSIFKQIASFHLLVINSNARSYICNNNMWFEFLYSVNSQVPIAQICGILLIKKPGVCTPFPAGWMWPELWRHGRINPDIHSFMFIEAKMESCISVKWVFIQQSRA
jgi:hypothetical protein